MLEHLWFLWYLLVFVTLGPIVVLVIGIAERITGKEIWDRIGYGLLRWNIASVALGVVSLPLLIHARGFMGWSLANPHGFLGTFPDFMLQYYPDQPFYLLYFLAGWWLFRMNDGLADISRFWLWNLTIGILGFAVARYLSTQYSFQTTHPWYQWLRTGTFFCYSLAAAHSAAGFIGLFQRFLDRPSRLGKYFADTALWIYLIHLPMIPYLIWWAQPSSGPWWVASLGGMIVITMAALVVFELIIRPTPLNAVFGPPVKRKE
jgi:glucan biosynthesis protein C